MGKYMQAEDLKPGDVIMFIRDLTAMGPMWKDRIPGAHLVVTAITGTEPEMWPFAQVVNTYTGKRDAIMLGECASGLFLRKVSV